jgi:hypothetical protein
VQANDLCGVNPKNNRAVQADFLSVAGAGTDGVVAGFGSFDGASGHRVGLPGDGVADFGLQNRHDR